MDIPFYSDINLNNNKIKNVGTPENNNDVANKSYIDTSVDTLHSTISGEISAEVNDINNRIDSEVNEINNEISNIRDSINTEIEDNIVDNLTTNDSTKSLSANQGYLLNNKIKSLEDSIILNDYATTPVIVGTYLDLPYYRLLLMGDIIKDNDNPGPDSRYIRLNYTFEGTGQIRQLYGSYIAHYQPELNPEFIVKPMFLGTMEQNAVKDNVAITGAEYFSNTIYVNIDLGDTIFNSLDTYSPLHYEIIVEFTLN